MTDRFEDYISNQIAEKTMELAELRARISTLEGVRANYRTIRRDSEAKKTPQ